MIDPLDTKLGAAGRVPTDDAHVRGARSLRTSSMRRELR